MTNERRARAWVTRDRGMAMANPKGDGTMGEDETNDGLTNEDDVFSLAHRSERK